MTRDQAARCIERLGRVNPGAVALARALSLAARIEPALVRRVRLALPGLDVSAEADLWHSDLVQAGNPTGITLWPEVGDLLRGEMAGDEPGRLERVWRVIDACHADAPWTVRLEERINYLSVSPGEEERARIEQLLLAAADRLRDPHRARNLARWLAKTLLRLPATARAGPTTDRLELATKAHLRRRLEVPPTLDADALQGWLPGLLPPVAERVPVGVRLDGNTLVLEAGGTTPDVLSLEVPRSDPLLLGVSWHDGRRLEQRMLTLRPGGVRRLRVEADAVELTTLEGRRFRLRPAPGEGQSAPDPGRLDFSGLRARHRPFFGREELLESLLQWVQGPSREHNILFLAGPRGSGKTALACRLLDACDERGIPTAYHFMDAERESEPDARVVASLVRQMRWRLDGRVPEEGAPDEDFQGLLVLLDRDVLPLEGKPLLILVDGYGEWERGELPPLSLPFRLRNILVLFGIRR